MPGNLISLFVLMGCIVNLLANIDKNDSTFVLTREWQTVKKGQPIPSGVFHIRHNFQTGLTEVKLLDKESKNDSDGETNLHETSLTLHPDKSIDSSEEDVVTNNDKKHAADMKISLEELKARLKKIKLLDINLQPSLNDQQSDTESKERLKRYMNLKNEFKALEVNVTSDAEMLAIFFQRFEKYKDSVATEYLTASAAKDILQILNELEYLLHQIDNAQTFAEMGGMAKIVSPCFNTTNDEIKAEALRVLGTAVQSNPKVQAKALEHDFVQKLLHILVINNKVTIQSRCLFALSALIRQYPPAQKAFIDHGGLEIFGNILEDGYLQTQSRVMNLINDLVVERRDLNKIDDEVLHQRKIYEYMLTDFEQKLLVHDYCKHLVNLMIKSFSNEAFGDSNMEDYDFLAVTLDNMIILDSICKRDRHESEKHSLLIVINEALRHYDSVKDASSADDDYSFSHLVALLIKLRMQLTTFEETHDEL